MTIRLMIAEDHPIIRAGVMQLMQGTEIELICQAETSEQTVRIAMACQPDVLLLDIQLAGSDGLSALEQIHRENPAIAVLVFSSSEDVKEMALARKLGAKGFVYKGSMRDDLLKSIRRVALGKGAWTPRQIRQVASRAAAEALAKNDRNPLSGREIEVLRKITLGLSNESIAEELEVDIETVKQHVKHILRKLHVEDRTQAAVLALRHKLLNQASASQPKTGPTETVVHDPKG
jgi:DNA-binding NarL/FixJ family response regulator